MGILSIVFIGVGLGVDAFAVAVTMSAWVSTRQRRMGIALMFGGVQAMMLIIGWLLGNPIQHILKGYEHWFACALLGIVGSKLVWEMIKNKMKQVDRAVLTNGFQLTALSLGTSIDAFAVGIGLGLLEVEIFRTCLIVGSVTTLMAFAGFEVGTTVHRRFTRATVCFGGALLILIGLRILSYHIF